MQELSIQSSITQSNLIKVTQANPQISPKLDLSIEGMRSQQFSEGVFIFLMIGIIVFSAILSVLIFGKNRQQKVKTGEIILIGAIILGVLGAVAFAAMQMLGGYLF